MSEPQVAFPADAPRGQAGRLRRRDRAARWALLGGVAIVTHLAFPVPAGTGTPVYAAGEVADRDVVAPVTFEVRKSREEIAREAEARAAAVRPVYRFDRSALDSSRAALDRLLAAAEDTTRPAAPPLTEEERRWLAWPGRRQALRGALDGFLTRYLLGGVADAGVVFAEPSAEVVLQRDGRERVVQRDSILTFADFVDRAENALPRVRGSEAPRVFRKFAAAAFRPSVVPDTRETDARRAEARAAVDSVKVVVAAGERIVAAREVVSQGAREKLLALRTVEQQSVVRTGLVRRVAPVLYNFTILSVCWLLLALYRRETWTEFREMGFLAGLFAATVLAAAGVARLFPDRPELLPVPVAALLVTLLYNGRLGVIVALVLAVLLGGQWLLQDNHTLYFSLVGGSAAALSVRSVRRRAHLFRAIWMIWAGYVLAAATLGLLLGWTPPAIAISALVGLVAAVASAALALLALPFAESATRITTDFTLIELADPSRPLLRRLATEAPGTYAHSLMLASMCETAADAIGANGLLARVGCYYHDVGKLRRPQYYVENQAGAANPHDKLKPQQSAQIIRSHVKEGLELAAEAHLPDGLQAFIREHHGTAPITYFLARARGRDPTVAPDAPEFRYPGPRPRSKETALVMLGDSVEAGLRVLEDPSPDRVRAAISHLVQSKVASGQLDDAPLTLRDLEVVKEAFTRVLAGLHHSRVEYPASAGGITAEFGLAADRPHA